MKDANAPDAVFQLALPIPLAAFETSITAISVRGPGPAPDATLPIWTGGVGWT